MKAYEIEAPGKITLISKERIEREGEVVVKISKLAVSATDKEIYLGKSDVSLPIIIGRAATGYVSQNNENSLLKRGEKVLINPYIDSFGHTKVMGVDCDGLLCDFVSISENNLILLPEGIKEEEALFTEYVAIAIRTIKTMQIEKGDYIAIIGAGSLGIILAQLAIYYNAIPVVIDSDADRLKIAEVCGVDFTINLITDDPKKKINDLTGGKMAEHTVVEAKNYINPHLLFKLTKEGGNTAIIGCDKFFAAASVDISIAFKRNITLFNINNGADDFDSAVNILTQKILNLAYLIDTNVPFDKVPEAFQSFSENPDIYKKMIITV